MAESIPVYERSVSPTGTPVQEFQSTVQGLAQSQNNLSAIGAKVAQSASNQMASELGYEQGKTPVGDLMPPVTDFDKQFADSYHAEAASTLGLQGQKLLDDAHVTLSQANRLTPDLIAKTHNQVQAGLNKIAEQAPIAIKGKLQEQFDSQLLNQTTQYREKMVSEQREDSKNNLQNGIDLNIKNALEFYKSNDNKAGDTAIQTANKLVDNALANRYITPEEARVAKETAKQTALNGQYISRAMAHLNNNTYPAFEKEYSEKKPAGMTNEQWIATGQAMQQQVNFIQGLRTQDENLKVQQMINQIAVNPGVAATQWKAFEESVSPIKAAETQFKLIQALKKHQSTSIDIDNLKQNWGNPEIQALASPKIKNASFFQQVDATVQNSQKKLPEVQPVSHEEAEVQVAAAAGGSIPAFINGLKNKINSSNPAFIESAAQQIHALQGMQAGHALDGLSDKDKALYTAYEALRDSRDPVTAARDATAMVNQDPETQQTNQQRWSNHLSTETRGSGQPVTEWALNKFGMNTATFQNPATAQVYGSDILNKYKTFYQLLNGDDDNAKKLTQQYIDQNYGETRVNGGSYKTLHPIEKVLGFQDHDGVPYIQYDVVRQITPKLEAIKNLYAAKKSNEYWEVMPLSDKAHGLFKSTYDPIQIKRHIRTSTGSTTDTFNVVLQGNAFDNWDVAIQTNTGLRNLFQVAPYLGVIGYKPDAGSILARYNKDHKLK